MKDMLSIADYFRLDKEIDAKKKRPGSRKDSVRTIRIAITGTSTLRGIREVLNVKCSDAGLALDAYVGEYNQYARELLDPRSSLYKFKPQLTILFLEARDILGEHFHFPYRLGVEERRELAEEKLVEILGMIASHKKSCSGKLLVHNLSLPPRPPMGILENRQEFGFLSMIKFINHRLEEELRSDPQAYLFDYDHLLGFLGKANCMDEKMRYVADMRLGHNYIAPLCDEYMRYIKAIKGLARKCIVLDLDNTLWGGILGEDGYDGICLGPTSPGNAFVELQKHLLGLYDRGVILAVNSSNDMEVAMRVIRKHPYMVLREGCFAAFRINWNSKADNIVEIARELNIGLGSIVFIDDDKRNRQLVREMLPEVLVPEMPEDPALYLETLKGLTDLDTLHITEEDRKRGSMYASDRKRRELKQGFGNISDFLSHLNIKVTIKEADSFSVPRISQLTQRTNQFNMTTKRRMDEDIRLMIQKKDFRVYSIGVEDKFGDQGIAGAAMLKVTDGYFVFDNFLLSCRILGKEIERAVAAYFMGLAGNDGAKGIVYEYIRTKKNSVARKFLEDLHFKRFKNTGKSEWWKLDIKNGLERPPYIRILTDEKTKRHTVESIRRKS